jgi:hypothetical protein
MSQLHEWNCADKYPFPLNLAFTMKDPASQSDHIHFILRSTL